MDCSFNYIGVTHTPYQEKAPYQPVEDESQEFFIELKPELVEGLHLLEKFRYIYVLFHIHRLNRTASLTATPPWTDGLQVGVFASRSPARPNLIGLSVVRIKRIEKNIIYTSGLDAGHISCPSLFVVSPEDEMPGSVPAVARDAYNKITGPKEWFEIAGGHFGLVYFPSPEFEAASLAQAHFLSKHLMRQQ